MRKLKILQINTEKTWRGGERQTFYTSLGLIKEGVSVSLIAKKNSPLAKKAIDNKINVIESRSNFHTFLILFLKAKEFDIIHPQSGKSHTEAVLTKIFHRRPIIYTRRVDFVPKGIFTRLKYKMTDSVISISSAISKILIESKMVESSKIISSAVANPVLNKNRALALKKSTLGDRQVKIVGIFSAFEDHKDPITLIEIAKLLRHKYKNLVFFHFGDGKLFQDFKNQLIINKLQDSYFCFGHKHNVEDFYYIIDAFLITSKMEGLGSSVMDAFNFEVPVISTKAGGLKELVKNKGFICEVGDKNCLAKSIENVLYNTNLDRSFIQNAKDFVDKELSVSFMIKKYLKEYLLILKNDE